MPTSKDKGNDMAKTECCPTCGRPLAPARRTNGQTTLTPDERAQLSTAELYAYYHRTAPREDLLFVRRQASEPLKAEIDRLLEGNPTAADARRIFDRRRLEHFPRLVVDEARFWELNRWRARRERGQQLRALRETARTRIELATQPSPSWYDAYYRAEREAENHDEAQRTARQLAHQAFKLCPWLRPAEA